MRSQILLTFLFFQGLWAESIHAVGSDLWLRVGEVRSLPASPSAEIRVGARGILRVVENGTSIQLVGLKPGVTPLVVDRKSYLVHISRSFEKNFFAAVSAATKKMKGLVLVSDVQPIEIHGTLLRFSDWRTLNDLAREFHGRYIFKAQALPEAAEQALEHLQKLAKTRGLPLLHFSADPQFTVHVPGNQKPMLAAVEDLFSGFGLRVVGSETQLLVQPLVRTQVVIAEVSQSKSLQFGVGWPASYQAQLLPKGGETPGLIATLKALESEGQAQILASPNLLCRSGGQAQFHAGGEFPIRVISKQTRDILWKSYGVILNVKPKADFQGAISIEIETEISLLDMAHAVDGIPALKSNKVKSHFDLTGRRTIALSGLIKQEYGRAREGLPLLGQMPVLGPLFSSRQFQAEQSELVVFVTPEIHTPDSDTPIEMPKGWVTHDW